MADLRARSLNVPKARCGSGLHRLTHVMSRGSAYRRGSHNVQTSASKESRMTEHATSTLYARLGGYDAIAAVADDLLARLMADPQLGRFWAHRAADSVRREKQLLIDFLCASAGGPMYYTGRDM